MSLQLFKADVLFYQRFLKANGFYPFKLDGIWGTKTDAADQAFVQQSKVIAQEEGVFDDRSETNIFTLVPKAQILVREFLSVVTISNDVRIISGTRTYSEQDALYRKGRFGNPGPRVTNAKGGQSNHNFGLAWDIGIFDNGKYITTDKKYKDLASAVLTQLQDIEWGGNWVSFKDFPHYQLQSVSDTVAGVRELFETGNSYV